MDIIISYDAAREITRTVEAWWTSCRLADCTPGMAGVLLRISRGDAPRGKHASLRLDAADLSPAEWTDLADYLRLVHESHVGPTSGHFRTALSEMESRGGGSVAVA